MLESKKIVTTGPTNDLQPLHEKEAGVWWRMIYSPYMKRKQGCGGTAPFFLTRKPLRISLTL